MLLFYPFFSAYARLQIRHLRRCSLQEPVYRWVMCAAQFLLQVALVASIGSPSLQLPGLSSQLMQTVNDSGKYNLVQVIDRCIFVPRRTLICYFLMMKKRHRNPHTHTPLVNVIWKHGGKSAVSKFLPYSIHFHKQTGLSYSLRPSFSLCTAPLWQIVVVRATAEQFSDAV